MTTNNQIREFTGEYSFLSNFYPCFVYSKEYQVIFPSVENAFNALKSTDLSWVFFCENSTPWESSTHSRSLPLRDDWLKIRVSSMINLVYQKFLVNVELRKSLLETKDKEIINGVDDFDVFWGVQIKDGKGANVLGQILMKVREHFILLENQEIHDDLQDGLELYLQKGSTILKDYPEGVYRVRNIDGGKVSLEPEHHSKSIVVQSKDVISELRGKMNVFYSSIKDRVDLMQVEIDTIIKKYF